MTFTEQKPRIDALLVERGMFESRAKAAASIMAGNVLVGEPGLRIDKPGTRVAPDVAVEVLELPRFVSRGGVKLANALDHFDLNPRARRCLDAGASTGGFTDCLLQAGASEVIAVDVGYGEFHWRLRSDARVILIERTNIRDVDPASLPFRPDLLVADLSFIGLSKVLPSIVATAADRFDLLALVKPQFELERGSVGKGGVVRDPELRLEALVSVGQAAVEQGLSVQGYCSSGLPGPAGNRESFIWCGEGARTGVDDLAAAAAVTEERQ